MGPRGRRGRRGARACGRLRGPRGDRGRRRRTRARGLGGRRGDVGHVRRSDLPRRRHADPEGVRLRGQRRGHVPLPHGRVRSGRRRGQGAARTATRASTTTTGSSTRACRSRPGSSPSGIEPPTDDALVFSGGEDGCPFAEIARARAPRAQAAEAPCRRRLPHGAAGRGGGRDDVRVQSDTRVDRLVVDGTERSSGWWPADRGGQRGPRPRGSCCAPAASSTPTRWSPATPRSSPLLSAAGQRLRRRHRHPHGPSGGRGGRAHGRGRVRGADHPAPLDLGRHPRERPGPALHQRGHLLRPGRPGGPPPPGRRGLPHRRRGALRGHGAGLQATWVCETVDELAEEIGLPEGSLVATFELYQRHAPRTRIRCSTRRRSSSARWCRRSAPTTCGSPRPSTRPSRWAASHDGRRRGPRRRRRGRSRGSSRPAAPPRASPPGLRQRHLAGRRHVLRPPRRPGRRRPGGSRSPVRVGRRACPPSSSAPSSGSPTPPRRRSGWRSMPRARSRSWGPPRRRSPSRAITTRSS